MKVYLDMVIHHIELLAHRCSHVVPTGYRLTLREHTQKKKRLSFGHCPKVASTPPPHFGHCEVTFVSAHFGQP